MRPHPGSFQPLLPPSRVIPVQPRDSGPQSVQLLPHAGVTHPIQGSSPGLSLLGGVASEILTQARAKTEMKPKDGIHGCTVFGFNAAIQNEDPSRLRPVISRLEVKQEISSQATPSLHRN